MTPRRSGNKKGKRLTPKGAVLKEWPDAYSVRGGEFYAGLWMIRGRGGAYPNCNCYSNHHTTPRAAWQDAAKRLRGKR